MGSSNLEKLWDIWHIPACVLLSLFLQVFLVLFASLRQRTRNIFLHILIWLAYLIADWTAAVTIGLITKVLTDPFHSHGNEDLYAFWASFLLLHLGGPDNITSFALQDNKFWLRHLFGLVLQVLGAAYCFLVALTNNNNNNDLLWLPIIIVLVVGTVKYAERTRALYLASLDHFGTTVSRRHNHSQGGEHPTSNHHHAHDEDTNSDDHLININNIAANSESLSSSFDHMELLMVSHSLFKSFNSAISRLILSPKLLESSRNLFLKLPPYVAFKLIEYELSFMYEVLHTKVAVVRSRIGLIFRLSSFFLILGAFIVFHFVVVVDQNKDDNDHEFGGIEMSITYALLIGAIGVDTVSGIKLIFSDWIIVSNGFERWRKYVPQCVLKRKRWCGSVPQYNMIDYCLHDECWLWNYKKLPGFVRGMVDKIKVMLFSSSNKDDIEELKSFIFKEVSKYHEDEFPMSFITSRETNDLRYAKIVLQLHLATEICYHQTEDDSRSYSDDEKRVRRMCKMISDYVFYLVIMKPEMTASVVMGNWKKMFQDTVAEIKWNLKANQISDHVKASNHFMKFVEDDNNMRGQGITTGGTSVVLEACKLGRDIRQSKWNKMNQHWIIMMCFGVIKCRPVLHAQPPSRGGELYTFILFLIHHLGFMRPQKGGPPLPSE